MATDRPIKRRTFFHRENACELKESYTQSEVHAAIRGLGRKGKRVRAYRCPYCRNFHITSGKS